MLQLLLGFLIDGQNPREKRENESWSERRERERREKETWQERGKYRVKHMKYFI